MASMGLHLPARSCLALFGQQAFQVLGYQGGVVRGDQVVDLLFGDFQLFEMADDTFPDRGAFLTFGQVKLGDVFLQLLRRDGVLVVVVPLDDVLLMFGVGLSHPGHPFRMQETNEDRKQVRPKVHRDRVNETCKAIGFWQGRIPANFAYGITAIEA